MTPFEFLQYVALEQLDAFAVDGRARIMAGFSNIADEAEEYANRTFESYIQSVGEADPGDFAEEARSGGRVLRSPGGSPAVYAQPPGRGRLSPVRAASEQAEPPS